MGSDLLLDRYCGQGLSVEVRWTTWELSVFEVEVPDREPVFVAVRRSHLDGFLADLWASALDGELVAQAASPAVQRRRLADGDRVQGVEVVGSVADPSTLPPAERDRRTGRIGGDPPRGRRRKREEQQERQPPRQVKGLSRGVLIGAGVAAVVLVGAVAALAGGGDDNTVTAGGPTAPPVGVPTTADEGAPVVLPDPCDLLTTAQVAAAVEALESPDNWTIDNVQDGRTYDDDAIPGIEQRGCAWAFDETSTFTVPGQPPSVNDGEFILLVREYDPPADDPGFSCGYSGADTVELPGTGDEASMSPTRLAANVAVGDLCAFTSGNHFIPTPTPDFTPFNTQLAEQLEASLSGYGGITAGEAEIPDDTLETGRTEL